MKIRSAFISNSSTSSYLCSLCHEHIGVADGDDTSFPSCVNCEETICEGCLEKYAPAIEQKGIRVIARAISAGTGRHLPDGVMQILGSYFLGGCWFCRTCKCEVPPQAPEFCPNCYIDRKGNYRVSDS